MKELPSGGIWRFSTHFSGPVHSSWLLALEGFCCRAIFLFKVFCFIIYIYIYTEFLVFVAGSVACRPFRFCGFCASLCGFWWLLRLWLFATSAFPVPVWQVALCLLWLLLRLCGFWLLFWLRRLASSAFPVPLQQVALFGLQPVTCFALAASPVPLRQVLFVYIHVYVYVYVCM